ncbi:GNAT family N-acetyltransferase [Zavarzinella formosa]|uniref:GNAT family N-acetyltransferase n=1 Tax=Zavarzinella formosa TaxID=360055 RepID=UPI0002D70A03|nr:GNAT family protein [Zavarzinella formosa]
MRLEIPILSGRIVRLEPLDESHREPLRLAAEDERIWKLTLTRGDGAGFNQWFDTAQADILAGHRVPFVVRQLNDGQLIGSTSYLDIFLRHKRIEIGSTWYHPDSWGTAINPECKLLLLAHAFEILGVNRVALQTDALNLRSQNAIAKLGATREGVLRSHMISQGGRVRDTVMFGIVREQWALVKMGLEARIRG